MTYLKAGTSAFEIKAKEKWIMVITFTECPEMLRMIFLGFNASFEVLVYYQTNLQSCWTCTLLVTFFLMLHWNMSIS